jgi:hypothetical protein
MGICGQKHKVFALSLSQKYQTYPLSMGKEKTMENLLAGKCGTQDGHGGKAEEHRAEMEEIARKVFAEEYESRKEEIYQMQC